MSLFTELITRVGLIVLIIDSIAFYLISKRIKVLTVPFAIGIIALTIIVSVINIWFCLHRRGIM